LNLASRAAGQRPEWIHEIKHDGVDGRSDFNGLHSRKHDDEVQFYAFDILVSDGEDLRKLPLSMRKTTSPDYWRGAWTASS
jgi:hypothetical protein